MNDINYFPSKLFHIKYPAKPTIVHINFRTHVYIVLLVCTQLRSEKDCSSLIKVVRSAKTCVINPERAYKGARRWADTDLGISAQLIQDKGEGFNVIMGDEFLWLSRFVGGCFWYICTLKLLYWKILLIKSGTKLNRKLRHNDLKLN